MLNTCRSDELNKHLANWLCCAPESPITDYYLCQHCPNHIVLDSSALIRSPHSGRLNIHRHIDMDQTQKAFLSLTPVQRMVLYLKIIMGFSNQDVADVLSKSIGTVKAIQNRALTTLSHLLDFD